MLVPGSQGSVLIAGDTGRGKSYLAGLLAERWIDAGYAVLVIDPEGDHVGLAQRPGVHLVDAAAHLPGPTDLLAITRPGRASLVLDLSGLPGEAKASYLRRLPASVAAERAEYGVPHWVITDEAHLTMLDGHDPSGPGLAEPGTCIVTWQADMLPAASRHRRPHPGNHSHTANRRFHGCSARHHRGWRPAAAPVHGRRKN